MSKKVITSPSGRKWRQFQIRVPVHIAEQIEAAHEKSGIYKAGFLRVSLITGAAHIAKNLATLEGRQPNSGCV